MYDRLDKMLVHLGLMRSRSQAADFIKRGLVKVNNKKITKPSFKVSDNEDIIILGQKNFVSRAAEKLLAALNAFDIEVKDKICLDIGASTGGFTQVLLLHGAKKVYAVDVGTNQLDESLKADSRVISLEQTDARNLTETLIPDKIDIFVSDVSFISITKILPKIAHLLKSDAHGVILIKPQFELSPELVKNGIVKDEKLHNLAINNVKKSLQQNGFSLLKIIPSPITGNKGNKEFLAWVKKC